MPRRNPQRSEARLSGEPNREPGRDAGGAAELPGAERRSPELPVKVAQLRRERDELRRELQKARLRIAELERLADEDALAPIANRRAFLRELSRMIAFTRRYNVPGSLLYIDVNGMKQINDVHGHPTGDAALRHVARLLCENVRSSDLVGRLGGDEFGVALAQTDREQAERKAAALSEQVRSAPLRWTGGTIPISIACGVYSFSAADDAHRAIEAADRAMYANKRRGCS